MVMKLEDKIRQYLNNNYGIKAKIIDNIQVLTHDIVEVCSDYFKECIQFEKENQELRDENLRSTIRKAEIINGLLEQIVELKKQLEELQKERNYYREWSS
jgi:cell shape-determining protein MreC